MLHTRSKAYYMCTVYHCNYVISFYSLSVHHTWDRKAQFQYPCFASVLLYKLNGVGIPNILLVGLSLGEVHVVVST